MSATWIRGGKDNRFQPASFVARIPIEPGGIRRRSRRREYWQQSPPRHGTAQRRRETPAAAPHRAKIAGNDNNTRRESHPTMRTEMSPHCYPPAGTLCRHVLASVLMGALGLLSSALAAQSEAGADTQAQIADSDAQAALRSIDQEVQDIKAEVLALNRDLFILEEELLFPANTQVAVFVSLDVGDFFQLDSVELQLDGKQVASYLYTERELEALTRGGVQRLFLGNLRTGEHELVAFFTGQGTHERDYRRGTTLNFEKALGTKYLELRIEDRERRLQPEFVVKQWD